MSRNLKIVLLLIAMIAVFTVAASAKVFVIDNMDDSSKWTGNGGAVQETENIKEGTGAVRANNSTLLQIQRKFDTPMDLSAYEDNGVISVWVYIDNVDTFETKDNSLEFTSSGTCDVEESCITLDNDLFEQGWNHLLFTMDDFASYDANWSAINFIRAYKFVNGANYWIWDDIKIGLESDFGMGKVKITNKASLVEGFDDPAAFTVDTANAVEGTGCATASAPSDVMTISRKYDKPIDLSRIKDNGYVYVWIYVENAAALRTNDGQLELTSSGKSDVNELGWTLPKEVTFKDGWNEILLKVDPKTECDLSAVNYMRLYMFTDSENTIKIDRLMAGVGEDFGIMPETEPVTEAPATTEAATNAVDTTTAADGTTAPAEANGENPASANYGVYIIIGAAVLVVIIVVVIIVANGNKKKSK